MAYNNEVTYNKCHTNKRALKYSALVRRYTKRTDCGSDCPVSWAEEVYYLLKDIDDRFGIIYCTNTYHGYFFQGKAWRNIFVEPFKALFGKYEPAKYEWQKRYEPKTPWQHITRRIEKAKTNLTYGVRTACYIGYRNLLNFVYKPTVRLEQVKEKYGSLRIYFSADRATSMYIDERVRECELRLAKKGVYYPIENLMGWSTTSYTKHSVAKTDTDGDSSITVYEYRETAERMFSKEEFDNMMLKYHENAALNKDEE